MQFTCTFATSPSEDSVKKIIEEFAKLGIEVTEKSRIDSDITFTAQVSEDQYQEAGKLLQSWIPESGPIQGFQGYTMLASPP